MNASAPIAAALTVDDVVRWSEPFADLLATTSRRVSTGMSPVWKSQAEREILETSALPRADGMPWGPEPASTSTAVAEILLRGALQHADAAHALLLTRPSSAMAIESAVRNTVEASSQVWWLLDPSIGARARVVRRLMLERKTAEALEASAAKMGFTPTTGYGKSVADTDLERRNLNVSDDYGPRGGWVGSDGQRPRGYTERAADFMREIGQDHAGGPYAFISGTAHAELWRMVYAYAAVERADGSTVWMPHTYADLVRFAVSVCIDAVIQPASRAFLWLGRGAALEELRRLEGPLKTAIKR